MIVASIHGRAGQDGELRESAAGKAWCRLNIAVEAGRDRDTDEPYTQWVTVVAFARQAEDLAKVEKGQTLSAMGRLEQSHWEKDGEQRTGWQLVADSVVTARAARPKGGRKAGPQDGGAPFNDDVRF